MHIYSWNPWVLPGVIRVEGMDSVHSISLRGNGRGVWWESLVGETGYFEVEKRLYRVCAAALLWWAWFGDGDIFMMWCDMLAHIYGTRLDEM